MKEPFSNPKMFYQATEVVQEEVGTNRNEIVSNEFTAGMTFPSFLQLFCMIEQIQHFGSEWILS